MKRIVIEHNARGEVRGLRIRYKHGVWGLYECKESTRPFLTALALPSLISYVYTPDV